jgi:hypothetical protein
MLDFSLHTVNVITFLEFQITPDPVTLPIEKNVGIFLSWLILSLDRAKVINHEYDFRKFLISSIACSIYAEVDTYGTRMPKG